MNNLKELIDTLEVKSESKNMTQKIQVNRMKEVLFDFKSEFYSLQRKLKVQSKREALFKEATERLGSKSNKTAEEYLLKERFSIANSHNAADGLLDQASVGLNALKRQKKTFGKSVSGLTSIGSSIPAVNQLMKRIGNKKTRDNTILAIVIALCISLILIYILHSWGL